MKRIKIILGLVLFASVTTFAQSPRIKLNQITKDTVKGSVLISSPSDSGMVYSRDFYIAYGADTVLILYGDTLGGVGGGFASVLTDGVTVTGDGTTGNELKVDTATVISTIKGLVDTLTARGYLTANETITLSGDVTGSGTTAITATVVDDSHDHIISNVDFLQDSLNAKANDSDLANYVTLNGTETITGAKTFTSDLNVDAKIALNDGDDNIVIGDGAGASLVSGQGIRNVLVGTSAGEAINSGGYNIVIGYEALYSNTTGQYNIANAYRALYGNTTGDYNIANGYRALYKNTIGQYNIANGYQALYNLSSGSDNQAYGYEAGRFYGSVSSNLGTANGSLFIGSNTRASDNGNTNEIVIGTNAIGNGSNSVTIGASTNELVVMKGRMELNDGGNSVFIGDGAGRVDDNVANNNVGIGYQALYNNTLGYSNTSVGYASLYTNSDGYQNISIGFKALYQNTGGDRNIGIGFESLYKNNAFGNIGIGFRALYDNINTNYNTAIGYDALGNHVDGAENFALGSASLVNKISGSNNIAIGANSGRYVINTTSPLDTIYNSIFIGATTKGTLKAQNEIVIGYNAQGNGSNTITIGSSTTQSLHTRNYEFDIDQTVSASEDNYVLTYDNGDGQISLEPISLSGSATLDFGSTSSLNSSDLTITVTGAADGDVVSLGVPNASVNANTNYTAWVSAANTVTVRFNNYSLGAVDPASGTFKVKVFK